MFPTCGQLWQTRRYPSEPHFLALLTVRADTLQRR
jgi:hypothetical protein